MRGTSVAATWRTAQVFLSAQGGGVFEVEIDIEGTGIRCNCPTWKNNFGCKHARFVQRRLVEHAGKYPVMVPNTTPQEAYAPIDGNPVDFRIFVVNHARIEVL